MLKTRDITLLTKVHMVKGIIFPVVMYGCEKESESCSVVSDSLWPHGLYSPWNSLGQNTGVGSLFPLQGIFPTQGLNPGLLHCRWMLCQLSHKGSPWMWEMDHKEGWVPKNWCFQTVVLEKALESSLDNKIKPVNPTGNQPWIFIGRTFVEAELQNFGHLIWRADLLKKILMMGKIECSRRRGRDG